MTDPRAIFPNIAKMRLAREIMFFLDWALEMRGLELTSIGKPVDVGTVIADYVDIDQDRCDEEMLHLEQVIEQEMRFGRKVN